MTDSSEDSPPNEIVEAARAAKRSREAAGPGEGTHKRRWPLAKIGLGVGIGSAAIAGAVLFANRDRDGKA